MTPMMTGSAAADPMPTDPIMTDPMTAAADAMTTDPITTDPMTTGAAAAAAAGRTSVGEGLVHMEIVEVEAAPEVIRSAAVNPSVVVAIYHHHGQRTCLRELASLIATTPRLSQLLGPVL